MKESTISGGEYNFTSSRAKLKIERILALLDGESLTVVEMGSRLHAAITGMHKYIAHLHSGEKKRIYIAEYDESGYRAVAKYSKGNWPDVPKPTKNKAQYWQEIKKDPEALARVHAHQAAFRERRRNGKPARPTARTYDPPLADQVMEFIRVWPGMTPKQIAKKLDANYRMTKTTLTKLRKEGKAQYRKQTRAGALWESTDRKVVTHAPIDIKKQNPFSALGI